jgi:hypothetical protein
LEAGDESGCVGRRLLCRLTQSVGTVDSKNPSRMTAILTPAMRKLLFFFIAFPRRISMHPAILEIRQ